MSLFCEGCGREDGELFEGNCPYAEDVEGEEIPCVLCPDCYEQRCMDI